MNKLATMAGFLALLLATTGTGFSQDGVNDSFSGINLSATPVKAGVVSLIGPDISEISSLPDAQLTAFVRVLDATPTIPAAALPRKGMVGAFWSLQNPKMPPLPGDTIGSAVWLLSDGNFLLNDVNFNYAAVSPVSTTTGTRMSALAMSGPPAPGGGGGANLPAGLTNTPPNYGTNLWIAQTAVASGYLNAIGSNTLADVKYEIQSRTNLIQNGWQTEGFIYGSELTNWTPLIVAQGNRTNLFLRLKSWGSSDASGIPDWWEALYGLTNVDPNALDSAGDGWTIYQKYQLGVNPNTWVTPAAPQGVSAAVHQPSKTASISWLPARGAVTGYVVEKIDNGGTSGGYYPPTVTDVSVSAATITYQDNISGNNRDLQDGNAYELAYRVKAVYGANSSPWSAAIAAPAPTVAASVAPGANGTTYLRVAGVPTNAVTIRLIFIDQSSYTNGVYDNEYNFTQNYPVSAFTNGLYPLTTPWPTTDGNGHTGYVVFADSVAANGDESAPTYVVDSRTDWTHPYNWGQPFYDARAQLKQNLIFQLRVADDSAPFQFDTITNNNTPAGAWLSAVNFPDNYVYSSYYDLNNWNAIYGTFGQYLATLNPYLPFEDNLFYRNFVFTSTDADGSGNMTTGVVNRNWFENYLSLWLPPAYLPTTNVNGSVPRLDANTTRWLCTYPLFYGPVSNGIVLSMGYDPVLGVSDYINYNLDPTARNYWGLPFVSAKVFYRDDDWNVQNAILSTVNTVQTWNIDSIYMETAQPQFQTVKYCFYRSAFDYLPGSALFAPTNDSPLLIEQDAHGNYYATNDLPFLIVPAGTSTQLAGYAKLAVSNGYPGVYAYLGQYFDKAYQVDDNGNVTTNQTGLLSPYGNYLATDVGVAALVTLPDLDTGARGTCLVYSVSLVLDKNHDGIIDGSFSGQDATSASSPYIFWANLNFDRWDNDFPFSYPEQDDQQIAFCPAAPSTITPDCNYSNVLANGYAYRAIPDTRDLEDYARLWVCGVTTNLLAALPAGSTITLSWGDVGSPNSANPTIDIFQAADADGGIGYQTNETIAATQTNALQSRYIGRLGPGQSIQLNPSSGWAGNHFIWCGVNNGSGGLTLTITDGSGNTLAQTTAYIQLVDIKQMYERWTVGDQPSVAPLTNAILTTEGLSAGESAFEYTPPTDTSTPYILLVHGYNIAPWEKDRYAETAFKRLYWQGYQGRFGMFGWPTAQHFYEFDASESQAWASAQGLLVKLNDLNAEYPGHVYLAAHSLGNVVAGEALRLAGSTQVVNTYVAMQGAVSSHAYDPTTTPYTLTEDWGAPDCYAHYWTSGAPCYFNSSVGAGTYVNFYNTNDWALNKAWLLFQNSKPVLDLNYSFTPPDFYYKNSGSTELFFPGNTYELFDEIIQSRSYALGMQPNVGGVFSTNNQVELDIPPYNFSTEHIYHSGEFRSDNPQRSQFWNQVLVKMKLKSP